MMRGILQLAGPTNIIVQAASSTNSAFFGKTEKTFNAIRNIPYPSPHYQVILSFFFG
jgi:hypothetical protein